MSKSSNANPRKLVESISKIPPIRLKQELLKMAHSDNLTISESHFILELCKNGSAVKLDSSTPRRTS